MPHALLGGRSAQALHDSHELVSAHSRYVVRLAAGLPERASDAANQLVTGQGTVTIVDLPEAIDIAYDDPERQIVAGAPGDFSVQMQEQRSGVRQAGQLIDIRNRYSRVALQRIPDRGH